MKESSTRALYAENKRLRDSIAELGEWDVIETAPKDGTPIQAVIPGHGSDNIIAWTGGLLDTSENDCGGWSFLEDQEWPEDWTDGVCWAVNADGMPSTPPTMWRPLPNLPGWREDAEQEVRK